MPNSTNSSFGTARKLGAAKAKEYSLVSSYKYGYRSRDDITNLPAGVLIVGSKNVLHNVSDRIQIRQGYKLDGAISTISSPILSSFDWLNKQNGEVHMKAGFLTSAGNDGKLQYRYVDSNGIVTWNDLITGLTSVSYNFTTFWKTSESLRVALFVNGASQIQEWTGAFATLASATATTLTLQGTATWASLGFYISTASRTVIINGVSATYSGGESTTTLTGVSVDFSNIITYPVGSVIVQAPVTTLNSAMTSGPSATFQNNLISVLNNQIYLGSLTSSVLYISKVDSYTDYSHSTPRQTSEGDMETLDANCVALMPQQNSMYVSAGKDLWYNISFQVQTSTVGVTYEQVNVMPLKTGRQQGAISQAFVSNMKNNIIMASNETTIDTFGSAEGYFQNPQQTNISDSIKLDIDSYNFTDGSIFYFQFYIYVAIPKEGIVRIYNIETKTWETPQTLPISRFYIVDGKLYGHSYNTSESYQLNTGYADRVYVGFQGYPISAIARFSYENYGTRSTYKKANGFYCEGYISANTVLDIEIMYELDGCAITRNLKIDGADKQVVCIRPIEGSLGKVSLGKVKLGGAGSQSLTDLPPKFRAIKTFTSTNFFESSITFSILGVNQRVEILAFGLNASGASEEPIAIKQ